MCDCVYSFSFTLSLLSLPTSLFSLSLSLSLWLSLALPFCILSLSLRDHVLLCLFPSQKSGRAPPNPNHTPPETKMGPKKVPPTHTKSSPNPGKNSEAIHPIPNKTPWETKMGPKGQRTRLHQTPTPTPAPPQKQPDTPQKMRTGKKTYTKPTKYHKIVQSSQTPYFIVFFDFV